MSGVPEDVKTLARETAKTMLGDAWRGADVEIIANAIMADRAARPAVQPEPLAREEMIREDERDRLYAKAQASNTQELLASEGAMLPAERQRSRATTGEA